jgi:Bacterial membrane protein YfhO
VIFASADSPLLRVLNLKYVATADPSELTPQAGIASVKQYGNIYLGEMASVVPRAFLVYSATVTRDDAQTLQLLRETPEAVFTRVLLSAPAAGQPPPLPALNSNSAVKLVQYAAEHSIWQVQTDQPGYLFLGDAYYPGWNAYLDDRPVDLYRANEVFRAVWVPAGEHQVSFRYEPMSLRLASSSRAWRCSRCSCCWGCSYGRAAPP